MNFVATRKREKDTRSGGDTYVVQVAGGKKIDAPILDTKLSNRGHTTHHQEYNSGEIAI